MSVRACQHFCANLFKNIFDINNIDSKSLEKIKQGLLEESKEKTYIDYDSITDEEIDEFLSKVQFIIDNKKRSEYVKSIVKVHPSIIPDENTLNAIFNEIRDSYLWCRNAEDLCNGRKNKKPR